MVGKGGVNIQTLGRGGESTSASLVIRMAMLVFGTAMIADDEEDYNKKQLYRILMPIWMNVIADTVTSGNPFNLFRIYGQWISDAAEFVRGSDE